METGINKYLLCENKLVSDALMAIEANNSGFAIVTDTDGKLCGVLTDGDLRRAFLVEKTVNSSIRGIYNNRCVFLRIFDRIESAIDIFKDGKIRFLPIVNSENKVVNVLTKQQLHALLLQDIHTDLSYDFTSLDEKIVDYEIFDRPWGFYKTTVYNEYFQSKIISVKPGEKLSLQSHDHREEHWIVVHGNGVAQLGDSEIPLFCGRSIFIPKGCKHRLSNTDDRESLIVTEVQIGDYLGEDDIKRYADIYGRV